MPPALIKLVNFKTAYGHYNIVNSPQLMLIIIAQFCCF